MAVNGQVGRLARSAGFRRNPRQHAGTHAIKQEKTPTENGWGFIIGGVVPYWREPSCLTGEDTVGEIIYDAEVRVDFGCLRAFPTFYSLRGHGQRPGFLTFRWRHE